MAGQLRRRTFVVVVVCVALLTLALSSMSAAASTTPNGGQCSQIVTPRAGDGWSSVAQRYGVSVAALKAANARYIRRNNQLWRTDRLCIPGDGSSGPATTVTPQPTTGATYTVRPGDTWYGIAARTGVPFAALWNANPKLQRRGKVLFIGDRMVIPGASASTPGSSTVTPVPPGGSATKPPIVGMPACPTQFADYTTGIHDALNANPVQLLDWLRTCGAVTSAHGGVTIQDINGDKLDDYIIVITDPISAAAVPTGDLLIFHAGRDSKELAYQAGAAGDVALLDTSDINADGKIDISWTDTTCGAHTCFGTVHIISWDPASSSFQNWIDGNATMAYPTVSFKDINDGSGQELLLHGGIIASVGAGPQRSWNETWSSLAGAPYRLTDLMYDPSTCLYHHLLDANQLMLTGKYAEAAIAYDAMLNDSALEKCGTRDNELDELRSFARYRLALAYAYSGEMEKAEVTVVEFLAAEPVNLYAQVADLWWQAYEKPQDAVAACAAVTAFAKDNPDTWLILFDFGYANPTFSESEVCVAPAA
ncbi:MAG: LysM peptidoglycan-binding domain-containing protein [Anaerolineae bacterium]